MTDIPLPTRGRLTFDAEGQEGGTWHSRHFHVPGDWSGLTIGRGYDMKMRSRSEVRDDMIAAGVAPETAALISQAAGLAGKAADEFMEENGLEDFEISPEGQLALFELEFARQEADTRRLATKADVTRAYGATDWDTLNDTIREVLVDLRFRGDYTPRSRRIIQACVARNDLAEFTALMADRDNWPNVPPDRFDRRKKYCEDAA